MWHEKHSLSIILTVSLNGRRKVVGLLRGFDNFLNIVLESALEITKENTTVELGTIVVRGASIVTLEPLEAVGSNQ